MPRNPATQRAIEAALGEAKYVAQAFGDLSPDQRKVEVDSLKARMRRLLRVLVENKATGTETESWKSFFRCLLFGPPSRRAARSPVRACWTPRTPAIARTPGPLFERRVGPPRTAPRSCGRVLPGDFSSSPGPRVDRSLLATRRLAGTCWKCGRPVYGDTGACSNLGCVTNDWASE